MDEKVLEIAELVTAATVQNGVDKIRALVRKRDPLFDGACTECSEPVPDQRLDTGATTCLDCQETLERHRALYKR